MFLTSTFLNFKALKFEGDDARISIELIFFSWRLLQIHRKCMCSTWKYSSLNKSLCARIKASTLSSASMFKLSSYFWDFVAWRLSFEATVDFWPRRHQWMDYEWQNRKIKVLWVLNSESRGKCYLQISCYLGQWIFFYLQYTFFFLVCSYL